MWDYYIAFTFDEQTNERINKLKLILQNKVKNEIKPWPPHITIDLYKGISLAEVTNITKQIAEEIESFSVTFSNLNDFDGKVLYLEPKNNADLRAIKQQFDLLLNQYRIPENIRPSYNPHATLCISDSITTAKNLILQDFKPFTGGDHKDCHIF